MEVTQTKSNKTYITKPYLIKTHLINTTTKDQNKNQKSSGGYSKNDEFNNNLITKIKNEYQIQKLTKTYERKIQKFSELFNLDIMTYAIEYAGEKSSTSPTNLLTTILTNWEQAGVQTLEQAKAQEVKYRNNHIKRNESNEKIPQWLLDKKNGVKNNDKSTTEKDFEDRKKELQKEMERFWKE